MAYATKVFTLRSTTTETSLVVNSNQSEMTSVTKDEDGNYSVAITLPRTVIRFNIMEHDLDKLKDALRGVDGVEIDAEYLAFDHST